MKKQLWSVLTDTLTTGRAAATSALPDVLMVGGSAALSYGAGLMYTPAGFVVAGVLAMVAGYLLARAGAK